MKKEIALSLGLLMAWLLNSCITTESMVQTAIAQTQMSEPTATNDLVKPTSTSTITPKPSSTNTPTKSPAPTNTPRPTRTPTSTGTPTPHGDYEIISIDFNNTNDKCMVNVRLKDLISEETIVEFATRIKEHEADGCDPLFIFYFLPGAEPEEASAYAISHFSPNLYYSFLGLPAGEKATLEAIVPPKDDSVVGIWIDDFLSAYMTIKKVGSRYSVSWQFSEGSVKTSNLYARMVSGKERLYVNSDYGGDYFLINTNGTLGIYDDLGLIEILQPAR